jgi:hypothetical protein
MDVIFNTNDCRRFSRQPEAEQAATQRLEAELRQCVKGHEPSICQSVVQEGNLDACTPFPRQKGYRGALVRIAPISDLVLNAEHDRSPSPAAIDGGIEVMLEWCAVSINSVLNFSSVGFSIRKAPPPAQALWQDVSGIDFSSRLLVVEYLTKIVVRIIHCHIEREVMAEERCDHLKALNVRAIIGTKIYSDLDARDANRLAYAEGLERLLQTVKQTHARVLDANAVGIARNIPL